MRSRWLSTFMVLALAVLGLTANVAYAQVTGNIVGVVKESAGGALPGASVETKSPALQGVRSTVTAGDGSFRFSLLPPGDYVVTFSLSGFSKVEKKAAVQLDKTVVVDATLQISAREEIVVTGEAPVVDATSSASGANFTQDFVKTLPVGRGFSAIATKAPGVIQGFGGDSANFNVYGSTGAENSFIIDGVDTTEVRAGRQGKTVNSEFVQEIEVKAGAFQAEYGHAQGGVLNAITKSGGNDFHGDAFGYYSGKANSADGGNFFQAADKHVKEKADTFGTATFNQTDVMRNESLGDYGLDLGGFFVKDRIWFFGAYDRVATRGTNYLNTASGSCTVQPCPAGTGPGTGFLTGLTTARDINQDLYAGKLTIKIADWLSAVGSVFGDPSTQSPNLVTPLSGAGLGTYQGSTDQGGVDYSGRLSGVVGASFLFEGQAAKHQEKNVPTPADTGDPNIQTQIPSGVPRQGGFGYYESNEYNRNFFKANVSFFATLLGSHELKAGGDYADVSSLLTRQYTGPAGHKETIFVRNLLNSAGQIVPVYQHEYNSTGLRDANLTPIEKDANNPELSRTNNTAYFIQDKWQVLPNLTLNIGFRYEDQKVKDINGATQIHVANELMPRVGFAWDFLGGGKSRVYGNYARFYETMPMDINIRSYGFEITTAVYNTTLNSDIGDPNVCSATAASSPWRDPQSGQLVRVCTSGATKILNGASSIKTGGFSGEPTEPGIKGQFSDEYSFGVEFQPMTDLSVGAKYIYRSLGRLIEDGGAINAAGDLEYFIFNPGTTFTSTQTGLQVGTDFLDVPPRRYYKALQFTAQKRFNNQLQFIASYTWSKLIGNYDGVFQTSTGQLDPNINSAYDYRYFLDHAYGYLSNDRRHTVKVDGSYIFPFGLQAGLSAHYFTGTPITQYGYSNGYRNYELYLSDRGTVGRTPDVYDADLHLGYAIPVSSVRILVAADIFNIFNTQRTSQVDMHYDLTQGGPQQGTYLEPNAFTGRRALRLNAKVSF